VLPIEAAIQELSHAMIGPFPLFIGPVGQTRGNVQSYGVTVDRSVRIRLPRPPSTAQPATPAHQPAADDGGEPTDRDAAVLEERRVALQAPAVKRKIRARRARRHLRRTHDARVRFKRKQQARMRRARTGWLARHLR
jgi:hypothetical protein